MPWTSAAAILATAAVAAVWMKSHKKSRWPDDVNNDTETSMRFIGHRGASAIAPENTLHAVHEALKNGVGFEVDLQLLRSGECIILHDDTLSRTAVTDSMASSLMSYLPGTADNRLLRSSVSSLSLDEVRSVQVGDSQHAERVPLFTDILELLRKPPAGENADHVHAFAEIKANGHTSSATFDERLTAAAAASVAEAAVPPERLTWISFSLGALLDIKRRLPSHRALLVAYVGSDAEAWRIARLAVRSGVDGLDLNAHPEVLSKELVDWLHEREKLVAVWVWKAPGSNDHAAVWQAMAQRGVDYFTSNLPPEVHEWRRRAGVAMGVAGPGPEP